MQNYLKPVKRKSRSRRFVNNSIIVSLLSFFSVSFHALFDKRKLAGLFAADSSAVDSRNKSIVSLIARKLRLRRAVASVRHAFATTVETSNVVRIYRRLVKSFFALSVRSLGVFLISAGLYSMLAYAINIYIIDGTERTHSNAVVLILMVITSLFLMFSGKSIGRKLCESAACSFVLFDLLGINRISIDHDAVPEKRTAFAFFGGLLFGLVSFFISPLNLVMYILIAISLLLIMYSPESGLLMAAICAPFAKTETLFAVLSAVVISYILKLLRGKRNLSLRKEDILALFFAFVVTIAIPQAGILQTAIIVSVYFMASNLLCNLSFIRKAANCISAGIMVCTFVQTARFIFDFAGINFTLISGIDLSFFPDGRLITILALPLSLYLFSRNDSGFYFIVRALFTVTALFNVCVAMSDTVWVVAFLCVFVYYVYRTVRLFNVAFFLGLTVPFILFARSVVSIYNVIEPIEAASLITHRVPVSYMMFGGTDFGGPALYGTLIESIGILGCALGALWFVLLIFRSFSSSSIPAGDEMRKLCAVFISSLAVFLLLGFYENTLSSENLLLIFWFACGMISASGRAVRTENTEEYY